MQTKLISFKFFIENHEIISMCVKITFSLNWSQNDLKCYYYQPFYAMHTGFRVTNQYTISMSSCNE